MAKKSLKLDRGTIYQKADGGTFYYRYQLKGQRKAISLKTTSFEEAKQKAREMERVVTAPSLEVVAAHVSHANFEVKNKELRLTDAWEVYSSHPKRATPATVWERQAYGIALRDFLDFVNDGNLSLAEVTAQHATDYANYLRTLEIAVDTHNRKIRRLRRIFAALDEYYTGENPFRAAGLQRKEREEQKH